MEQKNKSHIQFAKARYTLETFMAGRGDLGARIALWLCTFWLRFLYRLGPKKKFILSISQEHPLVNSLDIDLMAVDKGKVNGEYVRLVGELRRYLNFQECRIVDLPLEKQFPKPGWNDKVPAFFLAFFPSSPESAWNVNVYSDVH